MFVAPLTIILIPSILIQALLQRETSEDVFINLAVPRPAFHLIIMPDFLNYYILLVETLQITHYVDVPTYIFIHVQQSYSTNLNT